MRIRRVYIYTYTHTYNAWMNKVPVEKIIHRDVGKVVKREKKKREREREKKKESQKKSKRRIKDCGFGFLAWPRREGEKEKMTNPGL